MVLMAEINHRANNIENQTEELEEFYRDLIVEDPNLSRKTVSSQADKKIESFRWYKYKEAFSSVLVEYLIYKYQMRNTILDPFAGIGTTLFASSLFGCNSIGIELLPIAQKIIETRILAHYGLDNQTIQELEHILETDEWENENGRVELKELRITQNAYPEANKVNLERFLMYINGKNVRIRSILELALISIVEEISYTRKDGQYLRWDYRANKKGGKKDKILFNKGVIPDFNNAITDKLSQILSDLKVNNETITKDTYVRGNIRLVNGSCLHELSKMEAETINGVITSPPYCNRYDYTRTYALELALLNIDEENLKDLRQNMLSSTVENREKDLLQINPDWDNILNFVGTLPLLQSILLYLEGLKENKMLNNNGIVTMIKGYFYEMSCVIQEIYRLLTHESYFIMVNDNVMYAGIVIPVDLILSRIAEEIGFTIENILVVPQKKGNSSQQMGVHGRVALRKCVYVWKKE